MKITLEDFPDTIYILLEDEFRAQFFKTAWKIAGGYRKLAKMMGVSNPAMLAWRRGINSQSHITFCSVKNIKTISSLLTKSGFNEYDLNEVQKRIKAYRDKNGRLWICNPKLPIEDSVELREIVTHLMCDGSAPLTPKRTSKYGTNSSEATEEFFRELNIFGDILVKGIGEHKERVEKREDRDKQMHIHSIPKAIPRILTRKFGIVFGITVSRIPLELFNGKRVLLVAIIRAFLIDEGSVRDTRVFFTSSNLDLLKDLRKICKILNYRCGKLRCSNGIYHLSVCTESVKQLYKDIMNIGPLPIKNKQDRLELAIELIGSQRIIGNRLEDDILSALSQSPKSLVELSLILRIRARVLWDRLKKLERNNQVKVCGKLHRQGGGHIWSLC